MRDGNGRPVAERKVSFATERGRELSVGAPETVRVDSEQGAVVRIPETAGRCFLRFRADNDASNALRALPLNREVRLCGDGGYELEVPAGTELELRAVKPETVKTAYRTDHSSLPEGAVTGPTARWEPGQAPDGTPAMKLARIETARKYLNDEYYENTEIFENETLVYANGAWLGEITDADYGRKFHIRLRLFDTVSRRIIVELTSCTNRELQSADYARNMYNLDTRAGEWTELEFDYTVYDPKHGEAGRKIKQLLLKCPSAGDQDAPLWLGGLEITETVTVAELSGVHLFVPEREHDAPAFQPLG